MLRKHQSKNHEDLRLTRGRPKLDDIEKKERTDINRRYYERRKAARFKSAAEASTQTEATVPALKPPKAPPKIPYTAAEPSNVIGMFHWLPQLDPSEALDHMKSPIFWRECCENGLDPLWAYRYLRWRLGRPDLAEWRRF